MSLSLVVKRLTHCQRALMIAAAVLPVVMIWPSPARSEVAGAVTLTMQPSTITVGSFGQGFMVLTNTNTGAEAGFVNIVDLILVTPSCKQQNGGCVAGGHDPVVFRLEPTTVGLAGSSCQGTSFAISLANPSLGLWQIRPSSPVVLAGTGAFCHFPFNYSALNSPAFDADLDPSNGRQTQAVAFAQFSSAGVKAPAATTSGVITVLPGCSADFDGNGQVDALTDGLLLLRALFGLRGDAVTSGAIGNNATRPAWDNILDNLNTRCGTTLQR